MIISFFKRLYLPSLEMRWRQAAVQSILKRIPAPQALLDIGCGDGSSTKNYAATWNLPLSSLTGVEPQEKYKQLIDFKTYALDIERQDLPFPDESFDLIICSQVLEHLKIVIRPLREMSRSLKTKGHLLLGIPNLASLTSRGYLLFGRDPICLSFPGPHIRAFTHRSFVRCLESNPNFSLEATRGSCFYPFPPALFEPLARWFPGLACYTFYLLRKCQHNPRTDWPVCDYPDESLTG